MKRTIRALLGVALLCTSSAHADGVFKIDWKLGKKKPGGASAASEGTTSRPSPAAQGAPSSSPHSEQQTPAPSPTVAAGSPQGKLQSPSSQDAAQTVASRPIAMKEYEVAGIRLGMNAKEIRTKLATWGTTLSDSEDTLTVTSPPGKQPVQNITVLLAPAALGSRAYSIDFHVKYASYDASPTIAGVRETANEKFPRCANREEQVENNSYNLRCAWGPRGEEHLDPGTIPGETLRNTYSFNAMRQGVLAVGLTDNVSADIVNKYKIARSDQEAAQKRVLREKTAPRPSF